MAKKLEISFDYIEHDIYVGQVRGVNFDDAADIDFWDVIYENSDLDYTFGSEAFMALNGFTITSMTLENNDGETEFENFDYIDIAQTEIKQIRQKLFYWGRKNKNNDDIELVSLEKSTIPFIAYKSSKAGAIATCLDVKGKFDIKKLTAVINQSPENQQNFWPEDGNYLTDLYYGKTKMDIEYLGTSEVLHQHVDFFLENTNNTTPVLYIKYMPSILKLK